MHNPPLLHTIIFILFLPADNMLIDLDSPTPNALQQLEKRLFVDAVTFELTPDGNLRQKLQKIDSFLPYLDRFPTIATSFRLKQPHTHSPVFGTVAVGGTFDHLHVGHQVLLLYTALSANKLVHIGITGEALLSKKKSKQIMQPCQIRMHHVQSFIKSIKPQLQVNLFELNDPFGVTIAQSNIDALVISEQTWKGGEKVNQVRVQRGMQCLHLILCPTISASRDVEHKVSSSSIREWLLEKNCLTIENYSEYRGQFGSLGVRMGVKKRQKIEEWWELLFLSYSQHWRHYHTNRHIYNMLQQWSSPKQQQRRSQLNTTDSIIVETAIFFHDIVYRPDSSTNEEDSVHMATKFLQELLDGDRFDVQHVIGQCALLILQTKNHEPSSSLSQILYDLDMGILNSEFRHYQEYAKGIKRQYWPLLGHLYAQKRAQLLNSWRQSNLHFSYSAQNLQYNIEWELFCLQNHDL